jgi:hypothetical protein
MCPGPRCHSALLLRCAALLLPNLHTAHTPPTPHPTPPPRSFAAAKHPELQARLARELAQAGVLEALRSGTLSHERLASLPFLDAFIKETMRLWPTAGTSTSRISTSAISLSGVRVPAGARRRAQGAGRPPSRSRQLCPFLLLLPWGRASG